MSKKKVNNIKRKNFSGYNNNKYANPHLCVPSVLKQSFNPYLCCKDFTRENLNIYLCNPERNARQLRLFSIFLNNTSVYYAKVINYFSNMLTLDFFLTTNGKFNKNKNAGENLDKANRLIQKYFIKKEFNKIIKTLVLEDVFFGYEFKNNQSVFIKRLPTDYCDIIGYYEGMFAFTFDFRYFDKRECLLELEEFPDEFKLLYIKYKETNQFKQILHIGNGGVCFKMRDDINYPLPFFVSIFDEIMRIDDKSKVEDAIDNLKAQKIIQQVIPMEKDARGRQNIVLDKKLTEAYHKALKEIIPSQMSALTSPMELNVIDLNISNDIDLLKEQEYLKKSFGDSLDSNKAEGLNLINIYDQSIMFKLLRQFEYFFNFKIRNFLDSSSVKIIFPDISYYNRNSMTNEFLKLAQFGYPKTLAMVSMGISQSDLFGLLDIEKSVELDDKLVPLSSSHTKTKNDKGRPTTEEKATKIETDKIINDGGDVIE